MANKNVKITISAVDKTKKALSSTQKGLSKLKNTVFSLKGALLGLGAGALLVSIAKISARFEDLRDSLSSVTGSIENGRKAFDFISDFATRTQFGVEELSRSFITLKASGIEPTEKLLRVFTDTAAVTTDQLGTLDAMTRVFSRGVQGGLGLEELNQIADRGVPVFKILEEQLGITRLEIAKFGQSTEGAGKILEALQVGLNKEFGGATETKLDNLSIATSNLQIALATAADEFGQAGFTGALTDAAVQLTEFIESNKEGIRIAGEYAGEIVNNLAEGFVTLARFIGTSRHELLEFLDALGFDIDPKTTEDFTKAITSQSEEVENLRKKIKDLELQQTLTFSKNTTVGKLAMEELTSEFTEQQLKLKELEDGYHHFRLAQAQSVETTNTQIESGNAVIEMNDRQIGSIESMSKAYDTLNEKVVANTGFEEARMKSMQNAFDEDIKRAERQKKDAKDNLDAFKQGKFGEIDMQKLTNKQMSQMGREALAEGAKHSKKLFRLNQALAIGEAIMNTAQGVTNALKLPFPINIVMAGLVGAMGAAQISTIRAQQPPAMFGGSRQQGTPFLVGERGPELFTPATAGTVTPNHQLGGGGATVNFNITTVDAQSFGALLDTRRGQIVNMINTALNNKGQAALV
jgi:hypothetical protein